MRPIVVLIAVGCADETIQRYADNGAIDGTVADASAHVLYDAPPACDVATCSPGETTCGLPGCTNECARYAVACNAAYMREVVDCWALGLTCGLVDGSAACVPIR